MAYLEGHPEQFDASVGAVIDELQQERRGADEIEARAMQAEAFLARGRKVEAQHTLEKAKNIQTADWLARFRVDTASARLESANGNEAQAKAHSDERHGSRQTGRLRLLPGGSQNCTSTGRGSPVKEIDPDSPDES